MSFAAGEVLLAAIQRQPCAKIHVIDEQETPGKRDNHTVSEPPITLEMFRGAAHEILETIAKNRKSHDTAYNEQWRRLWSLLRLLKSSGPRLQLHDRGPWALKSPDPSRPGLQQWLVGGNLWLAVVLPAEAHEGDPQLLADLPKILNAARVEPPDD